MPEAIIDGASVAADGGLRVGDLEAVLDAVERAGYDAMVVIDETAAGNADDPEGLRRLLDSGRARRAPSGADVDYYVLEQCEARGAIVVSNGDYSSRTGRYPWVNDRRVGVTIADGRATLDEQALAHVRADDLITEASKESFPASDPPGW